MRIIYIANVRIPTERAHGIQIMNTCAALSSLGHLVELVAPKRAGRPKGDPFDFYKLRQRFPMRYLPTIDLIGPGGNRIAFWLQTITFLAAILVRYAGDLKNENVVFYGREEFILAVVSLFSKRVFWESHMGSDNLSSRSLLKRAKGIICITKGLERFYLSKGVPTTCLHVAPDAVDLSRFSVIDEDTGELRARLGLPLKAKIITYCGSLGSYSWKGADVLLSSLFYIKEKDCSVLIVGGSKEEIEKMRNAFPDKRIVFAGQVTPDRVPEYLKASDALVIPNKKGNLISEAYTSPMKLFEYMASRKPIIASDLPSIREVLSNGNSVLVPSDDPQSLAAGIDSVLCDPAFSERIAAKAYEDVRDFTWERRAMGIADFILKA